MSSYSSDPIQINRDFNQIFEKFPHHDLNTTILVSNLPNMLEKYVKNHSFKQPIELKIQKWPIKLIPQKYFHKIALSHCLIQRGNDLLLPAYTPNSLRENFFQDTIITSLIKYLRGMKILTNRDSKIADIRLFLNSKSLQFID